MPNTSHQTVIIITTIAIIKSSLTCTHRKTCVRPGVSHAVRARLSKQVKTKVAAKPETQNMRKEGRVVFKRKLPIGRLPRPTNWNHPPIPWNLNGLAGTQH